jgi:DnaJ-class molecular chaperone
MVENIVNVSKIWESITKKIVPCLSCNGSGITEVSELVSYHNNDYDYFNKVCCNCDGEGRMLETKITAKISVKIKDMRIDKNVDFSTSHHEKLNGRTIQDIYKITT